MRRRTFLQTTAAALAAPALVRAETTTTLKFVPYADLALLDPAVSAFVTRNHVMMVFDTLFAMDANGVPQPQMLEGYVTEDDGLSWTLTLRDGLRSWRISRGCHRRYLMPKVSRQVLISLFRSTPYEFLVVSITLVSAEVGGMNFGGGTPGRVTGKPSVSCRIACPFAVMSQLTNTFAAFGWGAFVATSA